MKRQACALSVAVAMFCCAIFVTTSAIAGGKGFSFESVDVLVPGLDGSCATAEGFGRYTFVVPSVSSNPDPQRIEDLDSNRLFVIDAFAPADAEPRVIDLGDCFDASAVIFNEESRVLAVRGTRITETEDGEFEGREIVKFLTMRLGKDGWPEPDDEAASAVTIEIPDGEGGSAKWAPADVVLTADGQTLIYSNGRSVFVSNRVEGHVYEQGIVVPGRFSRNNAITGLELDQATNTLVIAVTRRISEEDNIDVFASELLFYELLENGTLGLLKQIRSDVFPGYPSYFTEGSNVLIRGDENGVAESALFVTNRGSLCEVNLRGADQQGVVKELGVFPELAGPEGEASARWLSVQKDTGYIGVTRRGYIRRPAGAIGKGRGIRRPAGLRVFVEPPTVVLIKLGKKGKIVASKDFTSDLEAESGLSRLIFNEGDAFVSTFSGRFLRVGLSDGVAKAKMESIGEIGDRVDVMSYFSEGGSFVAVRSLQRVDPDAEDAPSTEPGTVVFARIKERVAQVQ